MKCLNCGFTLSGNEDFCSNCGIDLPRRKKSASGNRVLCPECGGAFNPEDAIEGNYDLLCPDCAARHIRAEDRAEDEKEAKRQKKLQSERAGYRSQRKAERFEVAQCFVRINKIGLTAIILRKDESNMCPLIDLSTTGLQCLASGSFGKGDTVGMNLIVPAFNNPLGLRGVVKWAIAEGKDKTRIGVEFDRADEKTLAHLEALSKHQALRDAAIIREHKRSSSQEMPAIKIEEQKERPMDF